MLDSKKIKTVEFHVWGASYGCGQPYIYIYIYKGETRPYNGRGSLSGISCQCSFLIDNARGDHRGPLQCGWIERRLCMLIFSAAKPRSRYPECI